MPLGRQAKLVSSKQQGLVLQHVATTRRPKRDRVIVLLSFRAGLRAKEIASPTWEMVMDAGGQARLDWPVIDPERGQGMSAETVTNWFDRLYCSIGLIGCSSH